MFDWEKYNGEERKKSNKKVWLLFGAWVVFTVLIAIPLAQIESALLLGLGFVGYLLAIPVFVSASRWFSQLVHQETLRKLEKEALNQYLTEKKLNDDFNEYFNGDFK